MDNCPKCEQLNSELIEIDDWDLCEDCMKEAEEFLKLFPVRYILFRETNELD